MIELRADGSKPGPHAVGRVYEIVDLMTGQVGYNCVTEETVDLLNARIAQYGIEQYDTFLQWIGDVTTSNATVAQVRSLNNGPKKFVETEHTKLVARVKRRLEEGHGGIIDGHDVLADMQEMLLDIQGRRVRPALPGWEK